MQQAYLRNNITLHAVMQTEMSRPATYKQHPLQAYG